ncbi:hypothetical protein GCM10023085_44730 [Actinomadura viridis]|uniref:DUF6879 domain-containing protein n=1 Tax=Actinomadura viridis TaxID=58110 RepID=A0A931DMI8_9ACTN|nr:DUF6879 family protein [Actinomadura viridis]MBG6089835.1 hypothetical protein [Actinomadura viridis]
MARLSPDEFAARFRGAFAQSAYRLEQFDHYVASNEVEPFRIFLSGRQPDATWREPWKAFVESVLAEGRTMARVHVVTEPLTDYAAFEITCVYPANVEAGEDVRILPRHAAAGLDLPAKDYWLLDSARVAVMDYDADGNWLSVDVTDEPDIVEHSCRARDTAMAAATPLNTYLAQIKESTEELGHGRPHRRAS